MDPLKQRIAIAEACGYKDIQLRPRYITGDYFDDLCECINREERDWGRSIPDYLNDLNAMHEAEKSLTPMQGLEYGELLGGGHAGSDSELNDCFLAAHATAAQRAEAFLKTIGKWETE